jgi:hypothetical protein
MARLYALLALALMISGCSQAAPPALPADRASCEAAEGMWAAHFIQGNESCILPTSDAGAACASSSECESRCLAPGRCAEWKPLPGGCYAFVEKGAIQPELCID